MSSWRRGGRSRRRLLLACLLSAAAAVAGGCGGRVITVRGDSMAPALSDGDRVRLSTSFGELQRGDVVAYRSESRPQASHLSRVVALPGEVFALKQGVLHVRGVAVDEPYVAPGNRSTEDYGPYTVPDGSYFLLSDNRRAAMDSRTVGAVERHRIWGRWAW